MLILKVWVHRAGIEPARRATGGKSPSCAWSDALDRSTIPAHLEEPFMRHPVHLFNWKVITEITQFLVCHLWIALSSCSFHGRYFCISMTCRLRTSTTVRKMTTIVKFKEKVHGYNLLSLSNMWKIIVTLVTIIMIFEVSTIAIYYSSYFSTSKRYFPNIISRFPLSIILGTYIASFIQS